MRESTAISITEESGILSQARARVKAIGNENFAFQVVRVLTWPFVPHFLDNQLSRRYGQNVKIAASIVSALAVFLLSQTGLKSFHSVILVTYGYWLTMSVVMNVLGRCLSMRFSLQGLLANIGVSLIGHNLVLILMKSAGNQSNINFFLLCMVMFGGLATFRVVFLIFDRVVNPALRFLIGTLFATGNLLHLTYLQYGFLHEVK